MGWKKGGQNNRQKVPKCGSNGVGKEGEIGGKRGAKDVKKWVRTEGEKGGQREGANEVSYWGQKNRQKVGNLWRIGGKKGGKK